MDKVKEREALLAAIEHWKENRTKAENDELIDEDIDSENCALCKLRCKIGGCGDCIIKQIANGCSYTPWIKVKKAINDDNVSTNEIISAVDEQIKYLQSLLPILEEYDTF